MPKTSSKKTLRMKLSAQIRDEVHFTPDEIRKKRNAFLVLNEWGQNNLTSKEKAFLWDCMFNYNMRGEEPSPANLKNRFIKFIWLSMKRYFDQNIASYGTKLEQSEVNNRVTHLIAVMEKNNTLQNALYGAPLTPAAPKSLRKGAESAQKGAEQSPEPEPVPEPVSKPVPNPASKPVEEFDAMDESALATLEREIGTLPLHVRNAVVNRVKEFGFDPVFDDLKRHPLKDSKNITQALVDMNNRLSADCEKKMGELLHLPTSKAIG